MKSIIKDIIFFILNSIATPDSKARILMYHSVGDNKAFFTVKAVQFERHLAYLAKNNFKVVFLSELIQKIKNKEPLEKIVCLTFDDGYYDNYKEVFPLLQKYKMPATIFLPTGFIGKEFMPHTKRHIDLGSELHNDAILDIESSRKDIRELIGTDAGILAYPKGKYTSDIVAYLQKNNWRGAVTVEEGSVDHTSDVYLLKRNSIDSSTSFIQFKGKVTGVVDMYQGLK